MKTKNMRKKALLSSVAMLLVAVVALSGATFAWFTANGQGTVSGMKMKAAQAKSLSFCDTDSDTLTDWKTDWDFEMATAPTIVPCSTTDGVNLYYVNASSETPDGGHDYNTKVSSIAEATPYAASTADGQAQFIKKTIWVKSGNGGKLNVKSVAFTGFTTDLRVSVTVEDADPTAETFIFSNSSSASTCNGLLPDADTTSLPSGTTFQKLYDGGTGYTALVGTQTVSAHNTTIIQNLGAGSHELTIRVWLEGNNSACDDSLSGKEMEGCTITFALA